MNTMNIFRTVLMIVALAAPTTTNAGTITNTPSYDPPPTWVPSTQCQVAVESMPSIAQSSFKVIQYNPTLILQYFYYATGNAAALQQAKTDANTFATAYAQTHGCSVTPYP